MKVLVACEYSGAVRDAFRRLGHDAYSCDLLESEGSGEHHLKGDVLGLLDRDWDVVVAFPPCTHLCGSGARWWKQKQENGDQAKAAEFFLRLTKLTCKWAIENPVGIMSSIYRKPDQIIQPWMFGHGEVKTTCLWLSGLPQLVPTAIVEGREQRCWKMPPSKNRAKERSRTYAGIAQAMALQWGNDERRTSPILASTSSLYRTA